MKGALRARVHGVRSDLASRVLINTGVVVAEPGASPRPTAAAQPLWMPEFQLLCLHMYRGRCDELVLCVRSSKRSSCYTFLHSTGGLSWARLKAQSGDEDDNELD